jgi:polyhydroxybutyrate depolymerase
MKIKFYILTFLIFAQTGISFAGFVDGSYIYKGQLRKYSIYIPDIYTTRNVKVPLLLGLHGYGDVVSNFRNICMTGIADTANYICVYAEGLPFFGSNAWNSGAGSGLINVNSTIDDVGFLNGLIDTVISKYKIDTTRMYAFGFSFGGFMTDRLATQNSTRFAAAANVAGLHGNFLAGLLPAKGMPYIKFHGTEDPTIKYDGSQTVGLFPGFGLSAENTVKFWVTQNRCDTAAVIDTMPDNADDGKRFVRFTYNNGRDNSKVVFYKVINGVHSWYGTPASDISYCQTIWSFFRQFSRTALVSAINTRENTKIKVYPNPSNGIITIDFSGSDEKFKTLNMYSISGNLAFSKIINNEVQLVIENTFAPGMYIIELVNENGIIKTEKMVVQ